MPVITLCDGRSSNVAVWPRARTLSTPFSLMDDAVVLFVAHSQISHLVSYVSVCLYSEWSLFFIPHSARARLQVCVRTILREMDGTNGVGDLGTAVVRQLGRRHSSPRTRSALLRSVD